MEKKMVVLVIGLLFCVTLIGGIVMKFKNNPEKLFEKTFGFEMPQSSKIEKSLINRRGVYLKIKTDEHDKEIILNKLIEHYGYSALTKEDIIPNFENTCSWWDMNKEEIIISYGAMLPGKKMKTRPEYSFIVLNQQNEWYLYIVEYFG